MLLVLSALAVVGFVVSKYFRVPAELKDIPEIPLLRLLWSLLRGEAFDDQFDRIVAPVLFKTGVARLWLFGRWQVIVGDFALASKILRTTDSLLKQPADTATKHQLLVKFLGESSIALSDGKEWLRHRKVANPVFKRQCDAHILGKAVLEMAVLIRDGAPVDILDLFKKANMDTLGRAIFSHEFNALAGKGKTLAMYNDLMLALFNPIYLLMPFLETLVPSRRAIHRTNVEFRHFLRLFIHDRATNIHAPDDNEDLLTLLIRASASSVPMSEEEIINDIATFFLAGHETTTNSLATAMYYLARHPEIQERARKEVMDIPSLEQQKQLTYIDCVIKESMRIITTVNEYRRYCTATTQISESLTIPQGSPVIVHGWAIHNDPRVFPNPKQFDPDRYLDPHGIQSRQWMAFGSGPRMCIGHNFAMAQQRISLAILLKKFTFELGPHSSRQPKPLIRAEGLSHPSELDIVFRRRV